MNIRLTWAEYALTIGAILSVYYAVICLQLYRSKLNKTVNNQESNPFSSIDRNDDNKRLHGEASVTNLFGEKESIPLNEEEDSNPEAQDFGDELIAFLSSVEKDTTKESLLASLDKLIQKYPSLSKSNHKYELSQLIALSSESYCSIHLSAEEISSLWKS